MVTFSVFSVMKHHAFNNISAEVLQMKKVTYFTRSIIAKTGITFGNILASRERIFESIKSFAAYIVTLPSPTTAPKDENEETLNTHELI